MPRPQRCRRICKEPTFDAFTPNGVKNGEAVCLTVDEYETIRLVDHENATHEECARLMDVSRTTVTEIYESARKKIAECIVNGRPLEINGGNYRLCDGNTKDCKNKMCKKINTSDAIASLPTKGDNIMRIAATYENGEIFGHFGHTEQFKIYDTENGIITKSEVINTMGSGHGALAGLLAALKVDVLICGGIGMGAQNALADAGIKLYGGISGNADKAAEALAQGKLALNTDIKCSGHAHHGDGHDCGSEGHSCGGNKCGEDKHGCSGNH